MFFKYHTEFHKHLFRKFSTIALKWTRLLHYWNIEACLQDYVTWYSVYCVINTTSSWGWSGRWHEIETSACWRTWRRKYGHCFRAGLTETRPRHNGFLLPWGRRPAPAALRPQALAVSAWRSASQIPATTKTRAKHSTWRLQ